MDYSRLQMHERTHTDMLTNSFFVPQVSRLPLFSTSHWLLHYASSLRLLGTVGMACAALPSYWFCVVMLNGTLVTTTVIVYISCNRLLNLWSWPLQQNKCDNSNRLQDIAKGASELSDSIAHIDSDTKKVTELQSNLDCLKAQVSSQNSDFDTEDILWNFANEHLGIPLSDIERGHRLGCRRDYQHHHPVIVKFTHFKQWDLIIRNPNKLKT